MPDKNHSGMTPEPFPCEEKPCLYYKPIKSLSNIV